MNNKCVLFKFELDLFQWKKEEIQVLDPISLIDHNTKPNLLKSTHLNTHRKKKKILLIQWFCLSVLLLSLESLNEITQTNHIPSFLSVCLPALPSLARARSIGEPHKLCVKRTMETTKTTTSIPPLDFPVLSIDTNPTRSSCLVSSSSLSLFDH